MCLLWAARETGVKRLGTGGQVDSDAAMLDSGRFGFVHELDPRG